MPVKILWTIHYSLSLKNETELAKTIGSVPIPYLWIF